MAYNLIGKDFTPMDVEAKVTGRAKYAEDFRADNMVFCKTLTSPIPHAKIKSIDTSEALKMPGVLGILTADDVPQFPPPALPILAKDEVYYVGDPILAPMLSTVLPGSGKRVRPALSLLIGRLGPTGLDLDHRSLSFRTTSG